MNPHEHNQNETNKKRLEYKSQSSRKILVVVVVLAVVFAVASASLVIAVRNSVNRRSELTQIIGLAEKQGGDITTARQIYEAMQKVSKYTKLPEDELPVLATIADVGKLGEQAIFKDAMNGDQVLVYVKTQRIYIFRPKTGALVNYGPFIVPSETPAVAQPTQSTSQTQPNAPAISQEEATSESSPEIP